MDTRSGPAPRAAAPAATPGTLGLALVRAAGSDPQLLVALRRLAWEAYLRAGAPHGLDERGLAMWWEVRLGAPSESATGHL